MAGESGEHGDICANLARLIDNDLLNTNYRGRIKHIKVRSGMFPPKRSIVKGMISQPDIVVICDEPEYHDEFWDVVLNPQVIIEVLSELTEVFDRSEKFYRYQLCNLTLTDYILVSQEKRWSSITFVKRTEAGSIIFMKVWSASFHSNQSTVV